MEIVERLHQDQQFPILALKLIMEGIEIPTPTIKDLQITEKIAIMTTTAKL